MLSTLRALRNAGRRDILGLVADGRIALTDVHEAYLKDPATLAQSVAQASSPGLSALVEKCLEWLNSPAGISPRTHRRCSPNTIERYEHSWNGFFATLPHGAKATLNDLTPGFVADYRRTRVRATGGRERKASPGKPLSGATLNRDLAALGAFLTWCRDVEGLQVARMRIPRERESRGRERWLSADELRSFEHHCPVEWWPFFAALFYTGARLGEIQGLRGADVLLHTRRLGIHEQERRVKTREAVRDLPISRALVGPLAAHLARLRQGPNDLVFPAAMQSYGAVRRTWDVTCEKAGIQGATPHDARHTYAVHASMAGVPIVRLQKLLGHATPAMTMRYMKHAPEAYLDEDSDRIGAHMEGLTDREGITRVQEARRELGVA